MHTKKSRNLNEQRTHRSFLVNRKIIHVYNKKKVDYRYTYEKERERFRSMKSENGR